MTQHLLKLADAIWNPGDMSLVRADGNTVRLSSKARETLACLADAAGDVVTRETLVNTVWPQGTPEDTAIPRVIDELREAIGDREKTVLCSVGDGGYQVRGRWVAIPSPPRASGPHWAWYVTGAVVLLGLLWVVTRGR